MTTEQDRLNAGIRKSIRGLVDEIVQAHDELQLPVDYSELDEVMATLDRIERRIKSSEPRPAPDPKKVADFPDKAP